MTDITSGALGTIEALIVAAAAILALFIGFCVLLTLPKLRASSRRSGTVRGLEELVGEQQAFLPADTPRGPIDQLQTPELREVRSRKTA